MDVFHLFELTPRSFHRAGATADAFTLFERLEVKLEEHPGRGDALASRRAGFTPGMSHKNENLKPKSALFEMKFAFGNKPPRPLETALSRLRYVEDVLFSVTSRASSQCSFIDAIRTCLVLHASGGLGTWAAHACGSGASKGVAQ